MADATTPEDVVAPEVKTLEVEPIPRFESESELPSTKPRYIVLGNTFVAQSDVGEIKIPLFFPVKKVRGIPNGMPLLEQIYLVFGTDSEICKALDELDFSDAEDIADKLYQAYSEKQRARLGK